MQLALAKESGALSATLLITGCCIGAGMVGLPVMSSLAGLLPSTLAMLLCYFFATATGLLMLEATLLFDQKVNLISMARFALGKVGTVLTFSLFLFLFYCLFVAYIDGGGRLIADILSVLLQYPVAREAGIFSCVSFVAAIVYCGTRVLSYISALFVCGLVCSYAALLAFGIPYVSHEQLLHADWKAAVSVLPILLVCFGYQNLIPTLVYHVRKNVAAMRIAIFVGNLIPFLIYFLWNYVILGILSGVDRQTLNQMAGQQDMVTGMLEQVSQVNAVVFFATAFSFFAVLTPFMANAMTFVDFLKDGFQLTKESKGHAVIYALIFVPPTLLTLFYPQLFLKALKLAGGCADVLLFGVLPTLIVWIGRYVKKAEGPYRVKGGKLFLIAILLLSAGFVLVKP